MIDEEDEDEEDDDWIKVDRGALEKPKMFEKDAEINHQLVVKKLIEIMAARGKQAVIVFLLYYTKQSIIESFTCERFSST